MKQTQFNYTLRKKGTAAVTVQKVYFWTVLLLLGTTDRFSPIFFSPIECLKQLWR